MNFNSIQKSILAIELVILIAGGAVYALVPEPTQPKFESGITPKVYDTSSVKPEPVSIPTEQERKEYAEFLKIDLNTADVSMLSRIKGIGEKTAEDIIKYREENGPFTSFEQLDSIKGIGKSTLDKVRTQAFIEGVDASAAAPSGAPGLIDLNLATVAQLQEVPGVGPATASAIIEGRPYAQIEDLSRVKGISDNTVEKLRAYVTVGFTSQSREAARVETISEAPSKPTASASGGKVNINTAGVEELATLNGIGEKTAETIIEHRNQNGKFSSIDQLDDVKGIGPATIDKNRDRMVVN